MASMVSVHEQVHQGTGKQEQQGKYPEQVRPMFGEEVEQGDRGEEPPSPRDASVMATFVFVTGWAIPWKSFAHGRIPWP